MERLERKSESADSESSNLSEADYNGLVGLADWETGFPWVARVGDC